MWVIMKCHLERKLAPPPPSRFFDESVWYHVLIQYLLMEVNKKRFGSKTQKNSKL